MKLLMKIQVNYYYSELDKAHCYCIQIDKTNMHDTYIYWIWYAIGSQLGNYRLLPLKLWIYPYPNGGKPIYKSDVITVKTSATTVGDRIAKKIRTHFDKINHLNFA